MGGQPSGKNRRENIEGKYFYITGCARSGTTLLQRLFYSFDDGFIIDGEIPLEYFGGSKQFLKVTQKALNNKWILGKRWFTTIFSNTLNSTKLDEDSELIEKYDVKIINIYRDGRDVIESGKVDARRWIDSIKQMTAFKHLITCNVQYENLIKMPDTVQTDISLILDLNIKAKFSEYPDFVPDRTFNLLKDKTYRKRVLSNERIGKNFELYKVKYPNEVTEFDDCLKLLNYI